jgi:undecaprenyl-diphosphatase
MSDTRARVLLRRLSSSLFTRTAVLLAAGAVAAIAFIEVVENVLQEEATPFDHAVSLWLHNFDSPVTDVAMRVFTFLGSSPAVICVVVLVAAWAVRRHARALAGVLVAVASVAEGLNLLLKVLFQRPRPDLFIEVVAPESYSFPSGHAMVAAAAYGVTAVVIARLRPRLRVPLYIVTPIYVLFIGLSRIFLGVHWATDVLAGLAAGGLVLVAGVLALGRFHRAPAPGSS